MSSTPIPAGIPGQSITGGSANDTLRSSAGDDSIDGQGGTDTVVFSAARAAYAIARSGPGWVVSSQQDGTDSLLNIERLVFTDRSTALDLGVSQAGGQAALLLGAVLGRAALSSKLPLVGNVMALLDQGNSLQQLAGAVMRLDIWGQLANGGRPGASHGQIAAYLLGTVAGTVPDAATLANATLALDNETAANQGNFLAQLALTAANQQQVNLVGLAGTGMDYGGV